MWPYLVGGLLVLLLGLMLWLWSLDIRFHAEGFGNPDGAWALAGALGVGPFVTSFVSARGGIKKLEVAIWRFKLQPQWGSRKRKARALTRPPSEPRVGTGSKWVPQGIDDVLRMIEFVLAQRHRVEAQKLDLECDYGFSDVALTGKLAAALTVLAGVLPWPVRLIHRPRWAAEDRAEFRLEGTMRLLLLPLLWETASFMLRSRRRHKRLSATPHSKQTLQQPQPDDS